MGKIGSFSQRIWKQKSKTIAGPMDCAGAHRDFVGVSRVPAGAHCRSDDVGWNKPGGPYTLEHE